MVSFHSYFRRAFEIDPREFDDPDEFYFRWDRYSLEGQGRTVLRIQNVIQQAKPLVTELKRTDFDDEAFELTRIIYQLVAHYRDEEQVGRGD